MSKNPRTIFEATRVVIPDSPGPRLVNPLMNIWLTADPIVVATSTYGSLSHNPAAVRNTALDIVFDCRRLGNDGLPVGIISLAVTILGTWLNKRIVASPIEITTSILGTMLPAKMLSTTALLLVTVSISPNADMITEGVKKNWVKWSNIGNLDFTVWKDNIAGERPLDWKGWVYDVKKLGNKVVVYGQNGVSLLAPSGSTYGLLSVHRVGLKGRQAVAGNEKVQFFVDSTGRLYSIGETVMKASLFETSIYPNLLDYSEYLVGMGDLVLSWDEVNNLLYICDGISGYVYSADSKSLGSGPINVTGVGGQSGTAYIAASGTIANPVFEICTDIYDMGSRKNKTISSIELGTDVTGDLWASIDYRLDKADAFSSLSWHRVNPSGISPIPCFGLEFRFRVKRTTYAYFELDYIKVNGVIHNYSYLDSYAKGGSE
uniref:Uncharacterized protein n=1 Tax=viral metagenome TaxID=1070528 RepID=A0A6M3KQT6_9ZZZZ